MSDYLTTNEIQKSRFSAFDMEDLRLHIDRNEVNRPRFVHIGGPSAVGKTTLSLILESQLSGSKILSIDAYLIAGLGRLAGTFDDTPETNSEPYIGGITPKVWELSLLRKHITELRLGKTVLAPIFDQTIKDRVGYRELSPARQVILEGGNSFSKELRHFADYKVLVRAPLHDRLVRKAVRTHARYGRDDLDDVWGRYLTKDEPSWRHYEPQFREIADQVFDNPSDPLTDFSKLPLARYGRAEGTYHKLTPSIETGNLHPAENLGIIEMPHSTYQLTYSVSDRDLVNLPLDKQFVKLLEHHYDIQEGETH